MKFEIWYISSAQMKNNFIITAAVVFVSLATLGQSPTNGLVAYYPFCGNYSDASTSGNHLTAFGNPALTTDRFNVPNRACALNGFSSYLDAMWPGPLNAHSRSVTFWAKSSSSQYQVAVFWGDNDNFGTRFEVGLAGICTGLYSDLGFSTDIFTANTADGLWHHYAVVYDSTIGNSISIMKHYRDGVLLNSVCYSYSNTQPVMTASLHPIRLGRMYATQYQRFFSGSLDEVRIYNRPLSASEVLAIYNDNCSCPGSPVAVTGNTNTCAGQAYIYSVTPTPGATSYTWTLPNGWTGTSSGNTISATAGASSGTISVISNVSCGGIGVLAVSAGSGTPSVVQGSTLVCPGQTNAYGISPVAGATSYSWMLPSGWSGSSTTNTIVITAGAAPGTITVTSNGSCGGQGTIAVQVGVSQTPIQGNVATCIGQPHMYTVAPVPGATSYQWTLPGGWIGTSNTNSIGVITSSGSGVISVLSNVSCGGPATLAVQVSAPPAAGAIMGASTLCAGASGNYSLLSSPGTTYNWTLPAGWSGVSGSNVITATSGTASGLVTVVATNSCGSSEPVSGFVTVKKCNTTLGDHSAQPAMLFPNPARENVTFVSPGEGIVTLINLLGEVLYRKMVVPGSHEITMTTYPKGIYMVSFDDGIRTRTFKLVRE
jgi:hypothetical protein